MANKSDNVGKSGDARKATAHRNSFGNHKVVREARANSPLTDDERAEVIREFNEWHGEPGANVNELVKALHGEPYMLAGEKWVYTSDGKVKYEETAIDNHKKNKTRSPDTGTVVGDGANQGTVGHGASADASTERAGRVKDDNPKMAIHGESKGIDDNGIVSKDTMKRTPENAGGNDGPSNVTPAAQEEIQPIPADSDDDGITGTDDDADSDGASIMDSIGSAFQSVGGAFSNLRGRVHDSWMDWTKDVRVPVEEPSDDEPKGNIIVHEENYLRPSYKPSNESRFDGNRYDAVARGSDNNGSGVDEFKKPSVMNGIRRVGGVFGSFVDGVAGRPLRRGLVHDHDREPEIPQWRRTVKWVVRGLAVIGGLALVRAAMDAFRPRR